MAIRDSFGRSVTNVATHKTESGGSGLAGFETTAHRRDFLTNWAPSAIAVARAAVLLEFGATRVQTFTGASMTAQEKEDTGVDRINPSLFDMYISSGSYVVHEGSIGNTIFENGTVYWLPCLGTGAGDFINFKRLLEASMAERYIDDAPNSTSGEKSSAVAAYNSIDITT